MLGGMPISVIYGPPNSGRAGAIRARLGESLDREPVLVVPTADDAARFERELVSDCGALLGAAIQTFHRLTDEIAAATGAPVRPLLAETQRLALVRSVARDAELRILAASRRQPGFAPALDRLLSELQAALVAPEDLAAAARELDDGEYEAELAGLYAVYRERREGAGRDDAHSAAATVASSLRERPDSWGARPVLVYGFDDLTEEQLDLLSALGTAAEVTVAVNYEDNDALAARAGLLARLTDELAADTVEQLPFDPAYTASATLRELDRGLFEVTETRVEPDGGLALLECGGERGEAEAVAGEIATLLARGVAPDDVVVVLRRPEARGALYDQVLGGLSVPVAVEASVPLPHTAVGQGVVALGRCSSPDAGADDLLEFLRARPGNQPQSIADDVERRARREAIRTATEAMEGWKGSQRDVARIREPRRRGARGSRRRPAERGGPVRAAGGPRCGGRRLDPRGAGGPGAASGMRSPGAGRGARGARGRARAAVARAHRRPRTGSEPLPGARRPRPSPVPGIAPGRRVSWTRGCRPAPRRGAAPAAGHRRPDAPGSGARGAVLVPRVRRPPDRAALALVEELGRGGAPGGALSVRGRRARPARPGRGGGRGSPEAGPWAGSRRVRA